jgi:hypothetical protein
MLWCDACSCRLLWGCRQGYILELCVCCLNHASAVGAIVCDECWADGICVDSAGMHSCGHVIKGAQCTVVSMCLDSPMCGVGGNIQCWLV